MVNRHNSSEHAKQCQLVTVTSPANSELKCVARSTEKRCPATLAKSVPTANLEDDNLVATWGDAKVASDEPRWNPAAVGNILGESATPTIAANATLDDGASASKLSSAKASPKTPKPVGPAKVLASAPPSHQLVEDMPPANASCAHPPTVSNPFMDVGSPSFPEKLFWPKRFSSIGQRDDKTALEQAC